MRQVPHYLIIGNGRVANHFRHYLSLLHLSFNLWHRKNSLTQLDQYLQQATHVLVLTNDPAIEPFVTQYANQTSALFIHFSGSVVSRLVYGAHPLMTFNKTLYHYEEYQRIPFILDEQAPEFEKLLPGLPNPFVRLNPDLKKKYHALVVLSGNFSCLLWQKLFSSFEQEFHFSPSIAHPYLQQITKNLMQDPALALTGPLVRDDKKTIENNLAALAYDPFEEVYKSFVSCYAQLKKGD